MGREGLVVHSADDVGGCARPVRPQSLGGRLLIGEPAGVGDPGQPVEGRDRGPGAERGGPGFTRILAEADQALGRAEEVAPQADGARDGGKFGVSLPVRPLLAAEVGVEGDEFPGYESSPGGRPRPANSWLERAVRTCSMKSAFSPASRRAPGLKRLPLARAAAIG